MSSPHIHEADQAQVESETVVVSQEIENLIPDDVRRESLSMGQSSKAMLPNDQNRATEPHLRDVGQHLNEMNKEAPQPVSQTPIQLQTLIEDAHPTNGKKLISWWSSLECLLLEPPVPLGKTRIRWTCVSIDSIPAL